LKREREREVFWVLLSLSFFFLLSSRVIGVGCVCRTWLEWARCRSRRRVFWKRAEGEGKEKEEGRDERREQANPPATLSLSPSLLRADNQASAQPPPGHRTTSTLPRRINSTRPWAAIFGLVVLPLAASERRRRRAAAAARERQASGRGRRPGWGLSPGFFCVGRPSNRALQRRYVGTSTLHGIEPPSIEHRPTADARRRRPANRTATSGNAGISGGGGGGLKSNAQTLSHTHNCDYYHIRHHPLKEAPFTSSTHANTPKQHQEEENTTNPFARPRRQSALGRKASKQACCSAAAASAAAPACQTPWRVPAAAAL
jgi:hypothetical protein